MESPFSNYGHTYTHRQTWSYLSVKQLMFWSAWL